ncbi:hypothetical protein VNO77_03422 [Canavalia gladiata]|uniref:Uncharacterized protein n=1 Tax=Canavalia gladiata TaxID=3824 RepID=A0AAN9RC82_CANGL
MESWRPIGIRILPESYASQIRRLPPNNNAIFHGSHACIHKPSFQDSSHYRVWMLQASSNPRSRGRVKGACEDGEMKLKWSSESIWKQECEIVTIVLKKQK